MKVELILPITTLSGKLTSKSNYYFRTVNGRTYVQRCPRQSAQPTPAQKAACELFAKRARMVAQLQSAGSNLTQKQLWDIAAQAL